MYNIHEISSTQFLLKFVKLIKLLFLSIICIIFGLYLTCVDGLAATSIATGTCCYAIFNCKESIGVILLVANKSFQWYHTIRGTMFSADVTVFEISIVSQHRVIADAIGHRAPAFIYVCLSLLTLKCSKFVIRLTLSLFIRSRIFLKITNLFSFTVNEYIMRKPPKPTKQFSGLREVPCQHLACAGATAQAIFF